MRDTGEVRGRPPLDVLMSMRDRPVRDVNGDSFGKLVEVYYDKATRVPEWLGVDSSLFGMTRILVPTLDSRVEEDSIRVAFRKEVALGTPEVLDQEISQDLERNLYAHYGLAYTYDESPTGLPATPDALAHPPAREFQRWAWPDIHEDDPLRVDAIEPPSATGHGDVRKSAGVASGRLRRIRGEGQESDDHSEGARAILRQYPEAPWFGGAVAALGLSLLAGKRRLRWAVAFLRLEAIVLLGIAVIEKRRKQAKHDAVEEARASEPRPSIVERVKSKVGMG